MAIFRKYIGGCHLGEQKYGTFPSLDFFVPLYFTFTNIMLQKNTSEQNHHVLLSISMIHSIYFLKHAVKQSSDDILVPI